VINVARGMRHSVKINPMISQAVVQRFSKNRRLFCLFTIAVLGGVCFSMAEMHQQSSAPMQMFLWQCRNPASHSNRVWRRQLLSGLLGVTSLPMVQEARAEGPIVFDNRKLKDLDPSKRVIVGDRGSAEVVSAIAKLQKARAGALQAKEILKADPLANVTGLFGLTSDADAGDSLIAAFQGGIKGANLEGPYAAAAKEQRAACSAIGSIMDGKTGTDTDRCCRLVISAWYSFVMDKDVRPLTFSSPAGEIAAQISRKRPSVQEKLAQKIDSYVAALDVLLKFVE